MARPMRRQQPMPLATRGLTGFRVGTVDKFRCREALGGDLTGQSNGDHRGQSGPHPGALPDTPPDDPGERHVPGVGRARIIPTGLN